MENNNELQELDDILNELHDLVQEDVPEVEPDEELQELLDLPEITVTPVVIRETAVEELMPEDAPSAPSLEDDTIMFSPVPAFTFEESEQEDTGRMPPLAADAALEGDTIQLPVDSVTAEPDAEPKAEPAFEVEEEFIPSPILFTPRSRLKELKKTLVAGPEKRYHMLAADGLGKLQAGIFLHPCRSA